MIAILPMDISPHSIFLNDAFWLSEWFREIFHMAPRMIKAFEWQNPAAFLLLFILLLWLWWYRNQQASFWERAFRFSPMAVIEHLQKSPKGWKRLLYPLWILLLQLCLILALARPVLTGSVPTLQVNLLLVMDISLSMMADDIDPNRLEASKEAASRFIASLPEDVRVGLELFAGNNYVVQSPTKDHDAVIAYINTLSERHLQMRTEIGSALKTAVEVLSSNETDLSALTNSSDTNTTEEKNKSDNQPNTKPKQIVVLMSDGDSQEGYPWSAAVAMARDSNISIYTIGVGSTGEASIVYQGRRVPVYFNENILRQIASVSGGQFFRVASAEEFQKVYEQVKQQSVVLETRQEDISWAMAGLAFLLLIAGLPFIRSRF